MLTTIPHPILFAPLLCFPSSQELLELIGEKKTISKTLEDYEGRRATSLTTAQRLSDFLGAETVKDKGLSCHLIITRYPIGNGRI
jgi:DNA polymerase epsilon subunit 1